MPEKIEELVRAALAAAIEAGDVPAFELDDCGIERPADTSHGEWTSTMALKSAKLAHCAPRKIADAVAAHLPADPVIEKVEIAGPGFINFYLSVAAKNAVFAEAPPPCRRVRSAANSSFRSRLPWARKTEANAGRLPAGSRPIQSVKRVNIAFTVAWVGSA